MRKDIERIVSPETNPNPIYQRMESVYQSVKNLPLRKGYDILSGHFDPNYSNQNIVDKTKGGSEETFNGLFQDFLKMIPEAKIIEEQKNYSFKHKDENGTNFKFDFQNYFYYRGITVESNGSKVTAYTCPIINTILRFFLGGDLIVVKNDRKYNVIIKKNEATKKPESNKKAA